MDYVAHRILHSTVRTEDGGYIASVRQLKGTYLLLSQEKNVLGSLMDQRGIITTEGAVQASGSILLSPYNHPIFPRRVDSMVLETTEGSCYVLKHLLYHTVVIEKDREQILTIRGIFNFVCHIHAVNEVSPDTAAFLYAAALMMVQHEEMTPV